MLWLVGVLGLAIGFSTGLLGAGPSIFTVLVLMHVAGLDLGSAVTTSLVVVALMSTIALVPYVSRGAVLWRAGLGLGLASMAGAFVGGHLSRAIPTKVLLVIFVATMVLAAAAIGMRPRRVQFRDRSFHERTVTVTVAGVLVGLLTGTVGLGGGFVVVPLIVLLVGAPMHSAVATSLFVIVMNTLAGLAGHLPHPAIHWSLALFVACAASLGSLGGAALGKRIDAAVLRRVFAVLMLVAAAAQLASSVRG